MSVIEAGLKTSNMAGTSDSSAISSKPILDMKPKKNGSLELPQKIETFKTWSATKMKCTKQVIGEKLGTTQPTRDTEIEAKVEAVKKTQSEYQAIASSVKQISSHLNSIAQLQTNLSTQLNIVGQRQPELERDFAFNGEAQRVMANHSANFVSALGLFVDGLDTFCNWTVGDFLETAKQMEQARIKYDAYRGDMERLNVSYTSSTTHQPLSSHSLSGDGAANVTVGESVSNGNGNNGPNQIRTKYETSRDAYNQLKADTNVKLKLLNENKMRVMQKQLKLLQTSTVSYFSRNSHDMEMIMSSMASRNSNNENQFSSSSFLETQQTPSSSPSNPTPILNASGPQYYFDPSSNTTISSDAIANGRQAESVDVFQE